MSKKIINALSILFLLTSCISIKQASSAPMQPNFVTATLVLPTTQWMPAAAAISTATEASVPVMTATVNCTNAAILVRDVTIPDYTRVEAGETFTKTWEFQNTGTCTWTHYTLKFSSGDAIHAPSSTPMPVTAPKERVQVSMELTAPTTDGSYAGYFALYDASGNTIPVGTEKTFWVKFLVGTASTVPVVSDGSTVPTGNCSYGPNMAYVDQVVALINAERAKVGLSTLTFDADLAAFAQSHADEMAYNNFLSHNGLNASFGERMRQYSMSHPGDAIYGEILAIGTPQNAMEQWSRDEHWDYVLGAGFTRIGVGYAYNSCSDFGGYFTVDFS